MFHDVQFPPGISYGSSGGPAFSTSIIETDSGQEQRVARWSAPRRTYNVGHGLKNLDDLYAVQKFFIARQGPAFGFRFKDWTDYSTTATGQGTPTPTDVVLGVGNGVQTTFQLRKAYADAASTIWRNITKPVFNTTVCALDGTPTSSFTVNTLTGEVTFLSAPGLGVVPTAGCLFDVPVRFGKELDNGLITSIDNFNSGQIPDIPLVEILDTQSIGDQFPYGGHSEISLTFDRTINVSDGAFIIVNPTTTGLSLSLPNPATMPTGGPYWYISQSGSNSFNLKNHLGSTLLSMSAGKSVIVCLTQDGGGTKYWYAL
jgi:uncharacterized protein (TIGR02217 family)